MKRALLLCRTAGRHGACARYERGVHQAV
jgi:hypothetical protein